MHRLNLVALLIVGGCHYPMSVNPVSNEATSSFDERLPGVWIPTDELGNWRGKRNNKESLGDERSNYPKLYAFHRPSNERTLLSLFTIESAAALRRFHAGEVPENETGAVLRVFTARGERNFFSINEKPGRPYLIAEYEFPTPDRLRIRHFNSDAVKRVISSKKLEGQITARAYKPSNATGNRNLKTPRQTIGITASTSKLRTVLENHPELFAEDSMEWTRVTPELEREFVASPAEEVKGNRNLRFETAVFILVLAAFCVIYFLFIRRLSN